MTDRKTVEGSRSLDDVRAERIRHARQSRFFKHCQAGDFSPCDQCKFGDGPDMDQCIRPDQRQHAEHWRETHETTEANLPPLPYTRQQPSA